MKDSSCQLIVAGGGVAGTCAAIAAARCGIRTVLVERESCLGGTGYGGMLRHICGLYLNGDTIPAETLNAGLTREITGLLKERAPEKSIHKIGQVYVLPYAANDLHEVLARLVQAETDLILQHNTKVTGVEKASGNIRSVILETPDGTLALAAAMVVDCTGNGDVAAMAGAQFELSPLHERQLSGFSMQVGGLKNNDDTLAIKVPYYCARGVEQAILPPAMKFSTFTYGDTPGEGFIKMSMDGEDSQKRDAEALEHAQILLAYLRRVLPAFGGAGIVRTSPRVMEREGRRIIGDYLLSEDDILSARKFPDAIVRNAWPVELWDRARGTIYKYVPRGDYYEIPFRCITVRGIKNLLTAGRCISVSHEALGSTRVMGTCMALGEQAGKAAAYYVRNGEFPGRLVG